MKNVGIAAAAALALLCCSAAAHAQGYARYPSYYGGGYYRAPYYGGGLGPSCGYYGCNARRDPRRMSPQAGFVAGGYRYDWSWGGGNRGYLGGRGGGWGGEW